MGEVVTTLVHIDSIRRTWLETTYPEAYATLLEAEALERAESGADSVAENEPLRGPRKAGDSG
jgi:hypothetical protein